MAYSYVTWAYKDPITVQKMTQMEDNTVFTSEHKIEGLDLNVTGNDTINIKGGRIELNGQWLYRDDKLTAMSADNAACWEDAAGDNASTSIYVVVYNDSGASFSALLRESGPAYTDTSSGTAGDMGMARYDRTGSTWYRYIGAVWNNAAGNLLRERRRGNEVYFDTNFLHSTTTASNATMLVDGGNQLAWTTASIPMLPNLAGVIPILLVSIGENIAAGVRPSESSATAGVWIDAVGNLFTQTEMTLPVNSGHEFCYKCSEATALFNAWLKGYRWDR